MRVVWVALLFVGVTLAGCTASDESPEPSSETINRDSFQLQSGKGAIAGLLVDDRFRPIHLVDNPQGEFQTTGFVLLQETGEQVRTNENGEFFFTNLDPKAYTLRVTAKGHEAIPQRVSVTDGVFNEASVVARRTASDNSFILTQEFSVFISCTVEAVIITHAGLPCTGDLSGESQRPGFFVDYSSVSDVATAMVSEVRFANPGDYKMSVRLSTSHNFVEAVILGEDYIHAVSVPGETNTVWNSENRNRPFHFNESIQTIIFPRSLTYQHIQPTTGLWGAGVVLGTRAQIIQSVFLGATEVDLDTYCVLC